MATRRSASAWRAWTGGRLLSFVGAVLMALAIPSPMNRPDAFVVGLCGFVLAAYALYRLSRLRRHKREVSDWVFPLDTYVLSPPGLDEDDDNVLAILDAVDKDKYVRVRNIPEDDKRRKPYTPLMESQRGRNYEHARRIAWERHNERIAKEAALTPTPTTTPDASSFVRGYAESLFAPDTTKNQELAPHNEATKGL